MTAEGSSFRLVVFADDWGRHPSSAQHLVRRLAPTHPTLWVNTVGTRRPRLNLADLRRGFDWLVHWFIPRPQAERAAMPAGLRVIGPRMYPGFRTAWQRRLNARLLTRHVNAALPDGSERWPRVAVTTLPITADLVGRLQVDRWVYYCVDDFSVWPGLDGDVMQTMERELVERVDAVVCASQTLVERMRTMGRDDAALLTHGVDLAFWQSSTIGHASGDASPWRRPVYLFWGLIDPRLDVGWCRALAERGSGTLVLVGPQQDMHPALRTFATLTGPVPYAALPGLAQRADVLVMPYADLPVTRAMQPLKLLEYLATGRPVVVRDLPATRSWADAADVVSDVDAFVDRARQRAAEGLPDPQRAARARLADETWEAKARRCEALLADAVPATGVPRGDAA